MKKGNLMVVLGALSLASVAQASVADMAGMWSGTGTVFSLQGDIEGTYGVQLVDVLESDGSVASAVTVSIPGQAAKDYEYLFTDTSNGFAMTSGEGSGGAVCLDQGLCEGYFGDASGNGVAITIIVDSPTSYRALKTELTGFKATSLSLEKYTRVSTK